VRLRYKLLPYLYNLYAAQEERGEAVLRPLFYDFRDRASLPLGRVDDQFMVGPFVMQAPFVAEGATTRTVVLPEGRWYRTDTASWAKGGRRLTAEKDEQTTPLFLRDGAVVPMQRGVAADNRKDLQRIELLVAMSPQWRGATEVEYVFDDGLTFGYRKGKRSRYRITARRRGRGLSILLEPVKRGHGDLSLTPVTLQRFSELIVEERGKERKLKAHARTTSMFGKPIRVWHWS
jgi:alpha-glucosidase